MTRVVNWNADAEIDLQAGDDLSRLPDSLFCPKLVKLFLHVPGLMIIPPTFFEHMSELEVLDLSNTKIVSLPKSISSLSKLRELFLRDCSSLMELPTQIEKLSKLKLFDIKGTELMYIPKEMGELKELEVLRISLSHYAKYYIETYTGNKTVIPKEMISKLQQLKELCVIISVGPEPEWWKEEVIDLQKELCDLKNLDTLKWYLPTNEVFKQFLLLERNNVPLYGALSNLMLTIGQHAQVTSCLPRDLEKKFEEFGKCIKWRNGEENTDDISKITESAEALFLSRHWTIEMLSNLKVTNLKYCLLSECNKMETLVEVDGLSEDVETRIKNRKTISLEFLQYLSIHHMNKLHSIWKGPIGKNSLSKLRILALHTCPQLTSIFTLTIAQNLSCLKELTIQDCPKVISVISGESNSAIYGPIFPSLENIFLVDLPKLVNIFVGDIVLENLRTMFVYSCLQLKDLSNMQLPHINKIKGQLEWWKGLVHNKPMQKDIFEQLKKRRDLVKQLFEATNSLQHFRDSVSQESILKLVAMVLYVVQTTAYFRPELRQLKQTLDRTTPIIEDVVKLNSKQQSDMFIEEIQYAQKLVDKCLKNNKRNIFKKLTHSLKLKDMNNKLLRFFQLEVQQTVNRDIKQTSFEVRNVQLKMEKIQQTGSGISWSMSSRKGEELTERRKLGWRVPSLPRDIVAFDEPLNRIKAKVLDDEASVVVVAAPGGCGKTTLVTMLCHDTVIQDKFGENVFFVTVSETPNFMVIVNDLFNPKDEDAKKNLRSDKDAKNKLGSFLLDVSKPVLLVLDDVWSDSFIDNFPLNIKGCKILVTSRLEFPKYDVFHFDPLSDEDAEILFRSSAFSESKKRGRTTIDGHLVNQVLKLCKKHPLTLKVVGTSLNGKDEPAWRAMLKNLTHGSSVVDLNEQVRNSLERSFTALDNELKECFMDFGLFPEDQRIPANALLDMWVHLYNHDDAGIDTYDKIVGLAFRNLIGLVPTSFMKDSGVTVVNYCDQQLVTQHDLLRELAIHLSSKPEVPIVHRKRLIINVQGEDLPASILKVQEPMQACILSISTGESFSGRWCDMKVPEVEVMVLNLKSKTYSLPHFMEEMQKLKILNVTNYGLYPSHIENFHLLGCLSNLLRIRLERVVISSLNASILALENMQKVSFTMCKIGDAFETKLGGSDSLKVWPRLVELEMDYCQDLIRFPDLLCDCVHLKTLSVTNCNEMRKISNEFGKLTNLENLSLQSCTKLKELPGSITRLQKLSILDISDCLSLRELPEEMGKLVGLRTIYMKGCTGIDGLPSSVEELSNIHVLCSEEMYYQWREFDNVKTEQVEEDILGNLNKIIR